MRCVQLVLASGLALSSVVACGGGSPPPEAPASTPASSGASASVGDAGASGKNAGGLDTAALDKLTAEESKSGTCDAEHKAALEKLLDDVEASVRAKTDDGGKPLKIESFTKRTMALSEASRGVQLTLSGKGTEVHVIAFSAKEVSLDVLAGNQPTTTMRSRYKSEVTNGPAKLTLPKLGGDVPLEGDSREFEMRPGTPLDVKMRGQGCAGVVVFSKS